jgi:hypothetical protein
MKKALLGAAVAMGMMVFAAPALAQGTGFIEICKSTPAGAFPAGLSNTPSFTYTVSNGGGTVVVPNNSCSHPIAVTAGNVTVTETLASFFAVASITTSPGSALVSSNLSTGTAVVAVPAAPDSSGAVVVNYRNVPVVGHIEICKNNAADASLTGSFTFTITGPAGSGFTATATVPIGHCSFPIAVPAGTNTVTETAPNSVSSITVQNGAPSTTNTATGTATVTVKPDVAPGDTSQEAIVTFFDETVNLKICKIASDAGVTSPYTFTVSAVEPAGGNAVPNRTVTVLPGQCQLVPGPYTNPNGTTGWRAGTTVTVSEGVVPGTAVTAITVIPASSEVPGAKRLSPLPNPTLPGPAGQDAAVLGAGETQMSFTNDTVPGGTLKICENPDAKAPPTAVETFTVASPTPAGSTTTAAVPFGSCTIVPNPVTKDGLWLYNSTVTIAQGPSPFPFVSVSVSPAARLLTPGGPTISVAIGSGDTTIATYTNDPPGSGGSSSGSGSGGGSAGGAPSGAVTIGGATVIAAVSGTTAAGGSAAAASHTQLRMARLIKIHGHVYLVVRVASTAKSARIRIVELNKRGQKVRSFTTTVATNRNVRLAIPLSRQVRVADVKLA